MNHPHEIRPDLEQGIDRKELAKLRARFLKINQGRLARAMEGLSTRQQQVLTLLPLFFHVNHPLLPGYVSGTTPAGVSGFEPDDELLAEAQRLTRSFTYKPRHGKPPQPIHGLFLMGSLGTLAQAEQSDMDLWVCHAPDLDEQAVADLRRKCQLLETWAASQGAEAHFFLIEPRGFVQGERDGQLSSDDCGTTQHYLLLDEFYRTAIWLAGRTPLWWLVPVYQEHNYRDYTQTLLSKRFVRAQDDLDLGHLAHIPSGEFVGAGLWQLFKGIDSPYKSLLKLLLTEAYASEHPQVRCLSLDYKRAVFANQLDLDELDPYVMVYRRIERYLLLRGEPARLELVRRSLYLKVNKKLGDQGRTRSGGWQRQLLGRLTEEWGWDERQLALLDSRSQWKVRQVAVERRELVAELNHSYRFLTQFARQQNANSRADQRDLNVLGRRLYAAFERRAGKIEVINPGIAPDLAEDTLTLVQSPNRKEPGTHHWGLYNGNLGVHEWEHFSPIKRCRELLELLTWAHRNGVIDSSTRLALHPGVSDLSEFELFNLIGSLQQSIPLPLETVSEVRLLQPSVADEILLLVNVGVDPLRHQRDLNILMTTERTDSLSYAGVRENLVLTLDQITLNSWNEVLVQRYDGEHALARCLRDFLNSLGQRSHRPRVRVRCYCHNRAQAISQRVEEIFDTVQLLLDQGLNHRYLLQVAQHTHILDLQPGQVTLASLADHDAVLAALGEERGRYSPLHLDTHALQDHDLPLVLAQGQPGCIQVFYRLFEGWADLYVLDEHNALWQQRLPLQDEPHLLLPLQRFLQSMLMRRDAQLPLDSLPLASLRILYYQLLPSGIGKARSLEPRPAPSDNQNQAYFEVQAILQAGTGEEVHVTLYCDQQEFSELEHGDQLYAVVARQILRQRRGSGSYRCYITDLDLSELLEDEQGSTSLYLRYKRELEQALNDGLEQLQARLEP
ncbi:MULTISPECIES: class I adenylate cyclase [unclassified Pseudomonas]|uniref:class I adenylate cyclase n=1 Tax=unclassified Pseudomonas TaxID=196821 RepID=UPI000C88DF81|nr:MULTISPECIES: class I adenylate cyclase [unclassified Pseudomonas]PMZ96321.1 class I adenylate cyclase [Pseudomonas sp. FW305-42]PNA28338.1 class I adenylate cyclase [Pseudomonas sp. MPR-R1B]PNB28804.1 class I adenylate cyclase [Pseudomonas sp. DP16D-E2]PNB45449.1 class I adenylate cyclase [Pseudomonas sp. FW305-17]PNB64531.1 class I adenylate cyclase [Pseudomonas sp. GW531-E2]